MLLLENRFIRSAFSAERLDAVKLIASQLERDLHDGAQQRLVAAMITLALAKDQGDGASELDATLSLRSKPSSSKHFRSSASLRTAYIRGSSPNRACPPPSAPSDNDHEPMSTSAKG